VNELPVLSWAIEKIVDPAQDIPRIARQLHDGFTPGDTVRDRPAVRTRSKCCFAARSGSLDRIAEPQAHVHDQWPRWSCRTQTGDEAARSPAVVDPTTVGRRYGSGDREPVWFDSIEQGLDPLRLGDVEDWFQHEVIAADGLALSTDQAGRPAVDAERSQHVVRRLGERVGLQESIIISFIEPDDGVVSQGIE